MKKWLFICLLAHQAFAFSQPVAKILFTTKQVVAERNNKEINLTRGADLFEGDKISTKADALARIRYMNGTVVSLQPNSTYQILAYNEAKKSAYLHRGGMDSETRGQKKATLETPVVYLAISGTKYRSAIFCQTAKCNKLAIEVTEGMVVVADNYFLGPGQKHNSGIYNSNTGKMSYGPINWSARGWVSFPATDAGNQDAQSGFINTTVLTQVVNSTVINTNANATVTAPIFMVGPPGLCPCC